MSTVEVQFGKLRHQIFIIKNVNIWVKKRPVFESDAVRIINRSLRKNKTDDGVRIIRDLKSR